MEEFHQNIVDHYHTAGVAKAREFAATDQTCPKSWAYRETRDIWREKNMKSDLYRDSKGTDVMWSREEAIQAIAQFEVAIPALYIYRCLVFETHSPPSPDDSLSSLLFTVTHCFASTLAVRTWSERNKSSKASSTIKSNPSSESTGNAVPSSAKGSLRTYRNIRLRLVLCIKQRWIEKR